MTFRSPLVLAAIPMLLAACNGEPPSTDGDRSQQAADTWLAELSRQPAYVDACDQTPGCGEGSPPASTEPMTLWRVQVLRDANGAVSFGRTESLSVPTEPGLPPGRAAGDLLLVGVDRDGQPVDGQMVLFPRERRLEYADAPPARASLEGQAVDTLGYLRADPSIVRLELRDAEGEVVDATDPPPAESDTAQRRSWPGSIIATAHALQSLDHGVPGHCAHILVLEGEGDRAYLGALGVVDGDVALLEPPGPYQLAGLKAALGRMTPMLCGAIGRVAFARIEALEQQMAGAVLFTGAGDLVIINTASYPEAGLSGSAWERLNYQTTITHESGHAVEALLNAEGQDAYLYGGDWEVPARSRAQNTLDNARLQKGFGDEWRRIHASFVDVGWARDHSLAGFASPLPDDQVVNGGFMTSYGSNIWWDDIAEYLSEVIMGPVFRHERPDSNDLACLAMQDWEERSVPSRLATAYTKVLFLRDLGLVTPAQAEACTGTKLGLDIASPGFHFWEEGTLKRSFTDGLAAGIGKKALLPTRVFTLEARGRASFGGTEYPASIDLHLGVGGVLDELSEASWPRGVYALGRSGENRMWLTLEDAASGNFVVTDGFALVTEASNRRIAGSTVIQKVFRPNAPMPVPERYDPPLVVRFMIEK